MRVLRSIEVALWIVLAVLTVVLPNAFKEVSGGALVLISILYLLFVRLKIKLEFILLWVLSSVITLVYLFVGYVAGAPRDAFIQIPFVYILAPLLWTISLQGLLVRYGVNKVVKAMLFCMIAAIATQAYFYWAFDAFGPDAVSIMAGNPNLDLSGKSAAATMYVFGSMIFLYGGLLAAPDIITNKLYRYLTISLVLISAFTSGRSALLLSLFIGVSVSFFAASGMSSKKNSKSIVNIAIVGVAVSICVFLLAQLYGIDVSVSFDALIEKIVTGGGAGRSDYVPLLFNEAWSDSFLGAGHGVGVQIVVNERFPWRYEVVGLATLYRVGIIGTLIYALPFVWAIRKSIRLWSAGKLSVQERFLCGAMISAFIAANTNPYIEAFAFQWMYVLPSVYFISLRREMGQPRFVLQPARGNGAFEARRGRAGHNGQLGKGL